METLDRSRLLWVYETLTCLRRLSSLITLVHNDPLSQPSNVDPISSAKDSVVLNEFLKWYEDLFVGLNQFISLLDLGFLTQVPPIILWVINLCYLLYILQAIYLQLMDLRSYLVVLVLLIFFLLYQLIMFFMSLILHLTYYLSFVSLIPLIVLFLNHHHQILILLCGLSYSFQLILEFRE